MKVLLILFFALSGILCACQPSSQAPGGGGADAGEASVDTTPRATAIFWVDKNKNLPGQKAEKVKSVRTVKAKVNIHLTGRVEVLSYVKPQANYLKRYISRRLESFRVKKVLMDSAYIRPGIQYVQLRYTPSKVRE